MNELQKVDRNLWVIIGVTACPFILLAFLDQSKLVVPQIYVLMAVAGLFNGLFVPFYLMKGQTNWLTKTISLGLNLVISALWMRYTGGIESIFYPVFFMMPIVAATMFGGFIDAIVCAFVATVVTLLFRYQAAGADLAQLFGDHRMLVTIVLFYMVACVVGYLFKIQREQFIRNQRMNEELEIAYNQLSASHDQLQSYTGIIEKMNKEMEQLAITDELTMLYNYRYFQITLDKELKRNRYSYLSLIMMDLDHFKQYNDRYGHTMGNRILFEIAKIIKENVRDVDTVVRYGGEEFAVILPSTETEEAYHMAERIRSIVSDFVYNSPEGIPSSVTLSSGIACFPKDSRNKSELISHADLALFKAKQSGRNKVLVYETEPSEGLLV